MTVDQQLLNEANAAGKFLAAKAPAAWEAVKQATAVDGISTVVDNVVFLAVSLTVVAFGLWCARKSVSIYRETDDVPMIYGAPAMFAITIGGMFCTFSFASLVNVWTWVQIFRPDLYLVHQAILKVVGS